MQRTSRAYKTEQADFLREESYVYVYLGVISREAQRNAVAEGGFTSYSDPLLLFNDTPFEAYYATAEENMAHGNGTQFFMPREESSFALYQGAVTQDILGSITFTFGKYKHLNIKGLTIDFGEFYPSRFLVSNGSARYTYEYTNNAQGKWVTEDRFLDTEYIKITPLEMVGGRQRLRILSILFGVGFQFDNTTILSTERKVSTSHLSDKLPSHTFTFTVENISKRFAADDPNSFVSFLQQQQEVEYDYGRKLADGSIYLIQGGKTNLKSWSSNDKQAKFNTVGYLDYSTTAYYKGDFSESGKTLFDLAMDVISDAGYEKYVVDTFLKRLTTHNPLPIEKHKNLLQLIANAAMSVMYEDRDGKIVIKSSFIPEVVDVSATDPTEYSNIPLVLEENAAINDYATAEKDYTFADGHQYFLPRSSGQYIDCGYISSAISDADGYFTVVSENHAYFVTADDRITRIGFVSSELSTDKIKFVADGIKIDLNAVTMDNPSFSVTWEAKWTFFNLVLTFGDVAPVEMLIHCYADGEETESFLVADAEIDLTTIIPHDFYDVDKVTVEFTRAKPYQRIHLKNFRTDKDLNRTGYAHIAFSVGSKEAVDELTAKIKDAGYVWHDGRFVDRWADDWILEKLELCFAHYEESDIRNALFNTHDLFRNLATVIAEKNGFEYPLKAETTAKEYIKGNRENENNQLF